MRRSSEEHSPQRTSRSALIASPDPARTGPSVPQFRHWARRPPPSAVITSAGYRCLQRHPLRGFASCAIELLSSRFGRPTVAGGKSEHMSQTAYLLEVFLSCPESYRVVRQPRLPNLECDTPETSVVLTSGEVHTGRHWHHPCGQQQRRGHHPISHSRGAVNQLRNEFHHRQNGQPSYVVVLLFGQSRSRIDTRVRTGDEKGPAGRGRKSGEGASTGDLAGSGLDT
jgi:hypothetical protein